MSQNSVVISPKGAAPVIFATLSRPYDSMKRERGKMQIMARRFHSSPAR
jgi:hypothetical protein